MRKYALRFSIVFNIIGTLIISIWFYKSYDINYLTYKLGLNPTYNNIKIKKSYNELYYGQKISFFNTVNKEKGEIIFLGNSIIDGCEWNEYFHNSKIKNRGIAGDRTDGVLLRINSIVEANPKKIFLLIGINDLSNEVSLDSICNNYKRIIARIRGISPNTQLYIHSILPINRKYYEGKATNEQIKALNQRIKQIAEAENITYIDLFKYFVNSEGDLDEQYSNDGLHLLGTGYEIWKSVIEKYVQ